MNDVIFRNKVEMRNFAYHEAAGVKEETVKSAVAAFIRTQGYSVSVGKERERGPDIRATKEPINLIAEAKGEGSRPEMFNNYFLNALGEIIQRRSMQAAEYGIALPAHSKFIRLVADLDDLAVRFVLRLNFYLVHKDGLRVGFLKYDAK